MLYRSILQHINVCDIELFLLLCDLFNSSGKDLYGSQILISRTNLQGTLDSAVIHADVYLHCTFIDIRILNFVCFSSKYVTFVFLETALQMWMELYLIYSITVFVVL